MCGGEFGSQRREKKKVGTVFEMFQRDRRGRCNRESERDSDTTKRALKMFFFFLFLFFSSQVGKEETDEEGKEEIVLPEFIVAGCGRTIGRVFTEKERQREVTKGGEKRRREGEQQFD